MNPESCLHELFERHALQSPDAIAVVDREISYTYRELERRANRVAGKLRSLGVRTESLVGICLDRGIDMIACILGTLKAGGAYLPLDPAYPDERLSFLTADSRVSAVLTYASLAARFTSAQLSVVDCSALDDAAYAEPSPEARALPSSAAYVIYTSGSSGVPKGVVVEHKQVLRLLRETEAHFGFDASDVWTMFHSFGFDFSVWELWGALAYGGKVVIVPSAVAKSPEALLELLVSQRVTVLNQTPSYFRQLSRTEARQRTKPRLSLRYVIFGGEALEPESLRPWIERHGDEQPQLVNMYGITETTVHVTYRRMRRADLDQRSGSPIGAPLADLRVYLLDADGQQVPDGELGELYVAGPGVARGYLNRPELNAQRFLHDPFSVTPQRMYRSGDLARRLPSGELSYAGRADAQLKIRGYRIEPGEIENALRRCTGVADVAVVSSDRGDGDTALVAYCVPAADQDLAAVKQALRDLATRLLPEHMRPANYVLVACFPLTQNGKIDRRALLQEEPLAHRAPRPRQQARTGVEHTMLELWRNTLGQPEIGLDDDFFESGGTSLGAIRLLLAVHERLGVELDMSVWAKHSTISDFIQLVTTD